MRGSKADRLPAFLVVSLCAPGKFQSNGWCPVNSCTVSCVGETGSRGCCGAVSFKVEYGKSLLCTTCHHMSRHAGLNGTAVVFGCF